MERSIRVGVGCTTYNRPECLAKWKQQIAKHTNMDNVLIYIADDSIDRKGVAFRKNECLRALKHCDYVFLFDDDCYTIKDGWIDFFVNSGESHLLFLNERLHNEIETIHKLSNKPKMQSIGNSFSADGNTKFNSIRRFKDCGGVFMFMTKEVINRVGAFNEKFETYSFEHADYSIRILGSHGNYPMLAGTEQYLYAEDYSNPNHKSSISDEEKNYFVKKNWDKFFNQPIKNVYLPL